MTDEEIFEDIMARISECPFIKEDSFNVNELLWAVRRTGHEAYINLNAKEGFFHGFPDGFWPIHLLRLEVMAFSVETWPEQGTIVAIEAV